MLSRWKKTAVVLVAVLGVIYAADRITRPKQAQPVGIGTHETQFGEVGGLTEVLDRSCGECHSATTTASWYIRVAPLSWIMARAAREGRIALDLSVWDTYSPERQHALLVASCRDAMNGRMPVSAYTRLRPMAQLSRQDVETICAASRQAVPPAVSSVDSQPPSAR